MTEKYKVYMDPDHGGAMFWDKDGIGIGDIDYLYLGDDEDALEVDLTRVEGMKEWYDEWVERCFRVQESRDESRMEVWNKRGLEIAKAVKALLPEWVGLYYYGQKIEL